MQTRSAFPGRKQTWDIGHLAVRIHPNSTHHVVRGWAYFHRLFRDIDICELLELVIHARELFLDVLSPIRQPALDPGDVQKNASVRATAIFTYFLHDAARDVIAGEQLRGASRVAVTLCISPALFFVIGSLGTIVLRDIV